MSFRHQPSTLPSLGSHGLSPLAADDSGKSRRCLPCHPLGCMEACTEAQRNIRGSFYHRAHPRLSDLTLS